jgi:hypothetical protein
MIDPTNDDIGRVVIYHDRIRGLVERGIVTAFNHAYVFVRYSGERNAKATVRQDLAWADD